MDAKVDESELTRKIREANQLLNKGTDEAVAEAADLVAEVDEVLFSDGIGVVKDKMVCSEKIYTSYTKLAERLYLAALD